MGKHTAGQEQEAIGCYHLLSQAEMPSGDQGIAAGSHPGVDDMRMCLHVSQWSSSKFTALRFSAPKFCMSCHGEIPVTIEIAILSPESMEP